MSTPPFTEAAIARIADDIRLKLETLNAEVKQLEMTRLGLTLLCPHTQRLYTGADPRGSSANEDRYKCRSCGKEWRE